MERYLAQLAAELDDSDAVRAIASDAWEISLEEDVEILLRSTEDGGAQLQCSVGNCPEETDALERLLLANFAGRGTLGATLGLNADETLLSLKLALASGGSYRELRDAIEDLYNCALFWRAEIPKLSAAREIQSLAKRKATSQ